MNVHVLNSDEFNAVIMNTQVQNNIISYSYSDYS